MADAGTVGETSATPTGAARSGTAEADRSECYRLLHLSDIHFGANFDLSLWEYIERLARREEPDLIVCTGDVVDHGGLFMLALARRQLEALVDTLPGRPSYRTVPGNHDVGLWGNLKIWPFSSNYYAVFGANAMALDDRFPTYLVYMAKPWLGRLWTRARWTLVLYRRRLSRSLTSIRQGRGFSKRLPVMRDDDPAQIVLIYLDSNYTPFLASGRVDVGELTRLKAKLLYVNENDKPRMFAPRIALIHHHPLPIHNASIVEGLTSFEPFLVLRNSGFLLKELNVCDVDLILHGHKHYSNFSRLGYSLDHSAEGEIAVLAAGSAGVTHAEAGRNSVNFVDLFRNGRIAYTSIPFGGGGGGVGSQIFKDKPYVHGLAMHKMRVHRRAIERHGQRVREVRHTIAIARGEAIVTHEISGLLYFSDFTARTLPIYVSVAAGRISGATMEMSAQSIRLGHRFESLPTRPRPVIDRCAIDLRLPLRSTTPEVSYGFTYQCFNTYATTEWETIKACEKDVREHRVNGRSAGLDFTGVIIRVPTERLLVTLRLPPFAEPPEPFVRVMRWSRYPASSLDAAGQFDAGLPGEWMPDPDLAIHEAGVLAQKSENVWELEVVFPMVCHRYDIVWRVRSDVDVVASREMETERRGVTKRLRRILLHLDAYGAQRMVVDAFLGAYREVVESTFPSPGAEQGLEVTLYAYDDEAQMLRCVHKDPADEEGFRRHDVPLSEGVVGAAFKRRAVVSYIDPQLTGSTNAAYLYTPDDEPQISTTQYVIAFPLFGVRDTTDFDDRDIASMGWPPTAVVGVLAISSEDVDSGLNDLIEASENETVLPEEGSPIRTAERKSDDASIAYETFWIGAHILLPKLLRPDDDSSEPPADDDPPEDRADRPASAG